MRSSLRDFLYFSKAQRRGIVLLIGIIAIVKCLNLYIDHLVSKNESKKLEYYAELITELDTAGQLGKNKFYSTAEKRIEKEEQLQYFAFNPNHLKLEGWLQLGLTEKQAQGIVNYRVKGGSFKLKSDLQRMYTISDKKYQELYPYILLPETIDHRRESREPEIEESAMILIDLNDADSMDLVALKGIGPVFASRILKYRKLLGGYCTLEQLHEVWGLPDSTVETISSALAIKNPELEKINLNSSTIEELAAHPYIDWNLARGLVNYREQHGEFSSMNDLNKIYLFNDSLIQRILPYLELAK